MANFGQLLAGAGRVSQGMEQARAVRQANEASAQALQQNRMRLEELRRMEEARARLSQLPSTIGDISFAPAGYQGMPTYEVPSQLQEIDMSTIPARIPTGGGDTNVDVSVADEQFYQGQQAPTPAPAPATGTPATGLANVPYEERVKYFESIDPRYTKNPITEFFTGRQRDMVQKIVDKRASGSPLAQKELGILQEYGPKFPDLQPTTTPAPAVTTTPPAEQPTPPAPAEQPAVAEAEDIPPPVAVGLDVGTKKDPVQTVAKSRPRMFEADPTQYNPYLEQGMRNREYLRQVANIYRQSGLPDKAFEIEAKIQGLDVDLYKMATDQAINEFRRGGDPARMIGLLQQFGSVPIDVQYRTDGNYNVFVNGTMLDQPLDAVTLTDELRTLVDSTYRQQKVDAQLANQKAMLDAQLETDKEIMKQNAQMVREAALAHINGGYNLAKEQLAQRGYTITNLNDGRVVISSKDGTEVGLVDLNNNTVVIDGQEIPVAPMVQPFQFQ